MSERKGLTLRDAMLSGKRFKRPSWSYWANSDTECLWDRLSTLADDYILEQSDADKIKELESKIQVLEYTQTKILKYCNGQTGIMWAAYIAGSIMNMDFRDVSDSVIKRYIESKESK